MDPIRPTEAELEILQVLWAQQPCTVKTVHAALSQIREVGYTTTLKQMQRMHEKGWLQRTAGTGKSHLYAATVERAAIEQSMFDRLVDNVFGSSVSKVVMHALGKGKPTPEELDEIRRFMDNLDQPE